MPTATAGDAVVRKLVTFGRILREAGVEVGPGRLQDALRSLDLVDLTSRDEVYHALRCTLVSRRDDIDAFDMAFAAFWERVPREPGSRMAVQLEAPPRVLPAHAAGGPAGDEADDEFEAFLLELLSDFQVTIPELGTIRAERRPVVFLTSNRTRELHDALKRRCLYAWVPFPTLDREIEIVRARVPGVAETIDWTQALVALGQAELDAGVVDDTLGSLLKDHEDLERVRELGVPTLLAEAPGG